jgi:hypothetical protein
MLTTRNLSQSSRGGQSPAAGARLWTIASRLINPRPKQIDLWMELFRYARPELDHGIAR